MRAAELRQAGLRSRRRTRRGPARIRRHRPDEGGVPRPARHAVDRESGERRALRPARAAPQSGVHARRRAFAGSRDRREYGHLLLREYADAAHAARREARSNSYRSTAPAAGARVTLPIRSIWNSGSTRICSPACSRAAARTKCGSTAAEAIASNTCSASLSPAITSMCWECVRSSGGSSRTMTIARRKAIRWWS